MEFNSDYFKDLPKILDIGLKKYDKTEKNLEECIQILKEWAKSQPHLPQVPSNHLIMSYLLMNKFSIEKAKRRIDMYYSMRNLFPDFFKNKHPLSPLMQDVMNQIFWFPMRNATADGFRVNIGGIHEGSQNVFNFVNFMAHVFNIATVRVNEECPIGDIHIVDLKNFKMSHLAQFTPSVVKKVVLIIEEGFTNVLKQIHFLNYPSYAEPMISLMKQVMKPKLAQRFHVHKEANTIAEFVPLKILPKDYGGEELSMNELNELWKKKFSENKEMFDELDTLRVREELRPSPLINDEVLGFHGNFMKLDVD